MAKQSPIKRITKCKVLPGSGVGICNDHFVSLEEVGDSTRCWWMYRLLLVSLFSKLRMLEFYYDCINRFVDRKDLQYIEIARIWRSLLLWRAYSNQEWRGSFGKSIGCSSLDVPVSLTTLILLIACWVEGLGSRVAVVNKSRNTTSGRLGCSKKNTKVQGLLLSTQRPMSVGTLSRTHRRRAPRELARAWMYWQQMYTKVYFRFSTLLLGSLEVSLKRIVRWSRIDNLLLCHEMGPWGWCFYNPSQHHLKVLVPEHVLESRSQVLELRCTIGWLLNQTSIFLTV